MAYHREYYLKKSAFIVSVYNMYKAQGIIHDTKIVKNHFPKHGIHISYRQWMNIKGEVIPKGSFVNKDFINDYIKIVEEFKPKTKNQLELKFE
jgi:hypothetical protein